MWVELKGFQTLTTNGVGRLLPMLLPQDLEVQILSLLWVKHPVQLSSYLQKNSYTIFTALIDP